MRTYDVAIVGRSILSNPGESSIVRTSAGVDRVHILFDSREWVDFSTSVSFRNGERIVTVSTVISNVTDSEQWLAECYVSVPHEVLRKLGPIFVTVQGTDASGNHIITAKGSPLTVVEAGDVLTGLVPEDVPTIDQWNQAYSRAMAAANEASSVVSNLGNQLSQMVADAQQSISDMMAGILVPATGESLGSVIVGDGLDVTDGGKISVNTAIGGMTSEQVLQIENLGRLASRCFDTSFSDAGILGDATVSANALPIATTETLGGIKPDGITVHVDPDGYLRTLASFSALAATVDDTVGTPSVAISIAGSGNAQTLTFNFSGIRGEKGDKGDKGDRGERGPYGYALTDEDLETICASVISQYQYGDGRTY